MSRFLSHLSAEQDLSGTSSVDKTIFEEATLPTTVLPVATPPKFDPLNASHVSTLVRNAFGSMVWFSASAASTGVIGQGPKPFLGTVKKNPKMLVDGAHYLLPYSLLSVEGAISFGKMVAGDNPDLAHKFGGAVSASVFEAATGGFLDIWSLKTTFTTLKVKDHFAKNKESLRGLFPLVELQKFPGCDGLTETQIIDKYHKDFPLSEKHLKHSLEKLPQLKIAPASFIGMLTASTPGAFARNACFYSVLFVQANAKDGDDSLLKRVGASLAASIISTIPKAWAYDSAMKSYVEGRGVVDSVLSGARSSAEQALKKPQVFATLVAIRTLAIALNSFFFSDKAAEIIEEQLRSVFSKEQLPEGAKLTDEQKAKVDADAREMVKETKAAQAAGKVNLDLDSVDFEALIAKAKAPTSVSSPVVTKVSEKDNAKGKAG